MENCRTPTIDLYGCGSLSRSVPCLLNFSLASIGEVTGCCVGDGKAVGELDGEVAICSLGVAVAGDESSLSLSLSLSALLNT